MLLSSTYQYHNQGQPPMTLPQFLGLINQGKYRANS